MLACSRASTAVDLKPETQQAFDRYIAGVEARLAPRFHGEQFLWFDDFPAVVQKIRNGAVVAQPAVRDGVVAIKSGLIQDWMAAAFVPKATLQRALSFVQDYDHHAEAYRPDVVDSKIRSREGNDFRVYMRFARSKLLVNGVFNSEHEIQYGGIDSTKAYSRSYSRRIAEVGDAGKPSEHELPVGQDRGLLWRLYGYWFFEERDGGVYIGCESITLTRDIPVVLMKLLGPVIHDVPGEALRSNLEQTRNAIMGR